MKPPRSFRITGKAIVLGLISFFLFFAAANIRSGWLYMVDAVLASVLLYSGGIVWRDTGPLRVTRRLLHVAQQGEEVPVIMQVENTGQWAFLCFTVTDILPEKISGQERDEEILCERFFLRLRAGETAEFTYYLPCRRRGRYLFSSYRLTLHGPLGLFSRTRTFTHPSELLVYPKLPDLAGFSSEAADLRQHRSGDIPQPFLIGRSGMLPKGVRDYQPGDSRRLIHWRSSARLGRMMVRDLEVETGLAFNLFLDTRPPVARGEESFESALKVVGAVAQYGLKHGHACQIFTHHGREAVVSAPRLLDFLARLEADSAVPPADALSAMAGILGARAFAILAMQRLDREVLTGYKHLRAQGISFSIYHFGPADPVTQAWCQKEGIAFRPVEPGDDASLRDQLLYSATPIA